MKQTDSSLFYKNQSVPKTGPAKPRKPQSKLQVITCTRNLSHGRIDACIQNLSMVLRESLGSGGHIKHDPKLQLVRKLLHDVVESAYQEQKKALDNPRTP